MPLTVHVDRIGTPLGAMLLGSDDEGLRLLEFAGEERAELQLARLARRLGCRIVPGSTHHSAAAARQLEEYFHEGRRVFDVPLALSGTPFQETVWRALLEIPWGATRSYGEQAAAIGQSAAVRAVARANGDNRIAIIVPCHRVIGADGRLTGYGGGLWRKEWLLAHERPQLGLGV